MENKELTDKPNVMLIVCKPNAVMISLELHKEIKLKKPEIDTMEKIGIARKLLPEILSSIISICENSHNRESAKSIIAADFVNYSIEFKRVLLIETLNCLNTHSLKGSEAYNEIVNQLQEGEKPKPKKSKEIVSFKWKSDPKKELPELYRLIHEEFKLISQDTTYNQIESIFSEMAINENFKPVKWEEAKNLNAYFIQQLIDKKKISNTSNKWVITNRCFVDGSNFSQLIDLYSNSKTGKPKGFELIDKMINAL